VEGAGEKGPSHNLIHVYEDLGLYIHEHHQTHRAICISAALDVKEPQFPFTPKRPYTGGLQVAGAMVPASHAESEFLQVCPIKFQELRRGNWLAEFDGFSIYMVSEGKLLPSGARSSSRRIVTVSITWPQEVQPVVAAPAEKAPPAKSK
jgi:hypothetical protein